MIIIRQLLNEHLFEYPSDQLHLPNLPLFLLIHLQVVSDRPYTFPDRIDECIDIHLPALCIIITYQSRPRTTGIIVQAPLPR